MTHLRLHETPKLGVHQTGSSSFRGLRSGGRGLGVPLRPNPVRPTPWAYDGVPGEGSIPAPLPPPPWPMQRFLRAVSVENGPISTAVSNSISGPLTPRIIPLFSEWPVSLLTSGLRNLVRFSISDRFELLMSFTGKGVGLCLSNRRAPPISKLIRRAICSLLPIRQLKV
jgi:hypothetical protein